jgi:polyhydroxybutyrate depolymerase
MGPGQGQTSATDTHVQALSCAAMKRAAIAIILAGCSTTTPSTPADAGPPNDGGTEEASSTAPSIFDTRPYQIRVPPTLDTSKPAPVVLVLHGYGASSVVQTAYLALAPAADAKGFILVQPDGTIDRDGKRFWNASPACCDFGKTGVDDVAYLTAVLDDVEKKHNVDKKRVFVVGHSNGGFMAHRLACEIPSRIAAIVSLAGSRGCEPKESVAVLQVHGDKDTVISYEGGDTGGGKYGSAAETVEPWAKKNACQGALAKGPRLDLDTKVAGEETRTERYENCSRDVELWTLEGGGHVPSFYPTIGETFWTWLSAHPKP